MNMKTLPEPCYYNPEKPVHKTRRQLPHWEQEGVCGFVSFRLADSLPESVLADHELRKSVWLRARGISDVVPLSMRPDLLERDERRSFYRFASHLYHRALDKGHGSCCLRDPVLRDVVQELFMNRHLVDYVLYAYVIMPNHVHALIQPLPGKSMIRSLRAIRRMSAREINRLNDTKGDFWQSEGFDHLVRSAHYFHRYRQYIRLNPARARLNSSEYSWMDLF
jgi:REP element-mobilizing transposase RayT